ncbi:MAG: nucleotidyltransferase domain-containing protein, partial [Candidatus Omnitrophica bacterium]|nr:nucleotidyltransferase domain-containing protein [Candidatus Omnitrophota bacterium]
MERIPKRRLTHEEKEKMIGEAYRVSYNFSKKVFEMFPGLIKAVVLFGSISKAVPTAGSDIDILIIIDDTSITPSRKFIDWYNVELANLVRKSDPRLHITTVTLTTFWENILIGEPVAINVLRYGVPLIDTGYFEPLQFLLAAGRIRPSKEAIYNAITRAPWHMTRANSRILAGITDLYWVMIDSAHAALMSYGVVPPSPEHIEKMLTETFVSKKMLNSKYVNYYREIWKTAKAIIHGEIIRGSGMDFDRYRMMAEEFEGKMKEI